MRSVIDKGTVVQVNVRTPGENTVINIRYLLYYNIMYTNRADCVHNKVSAGADHSPSV